MNCPGQPLGCGVTRVRAKVLAINIKTKHNIGWPWGRLLSLLILLRLQLAFISEFPSWNKDFPGSFPGSSVSVHFIAVYNQIQRRGSLGQDLLSFSLSCFLTFFILCLLWQVVGIQNARHRIPLLRCAQPAPDIQTDTQTWLKC